MPNLTVPPWSDWIRTTGVPVLVILILAILALRGARIFVHGVVKTLFDRETKEGAAKELTGLEIARRRDTIETLGARVLQTFVLIVAVLMIIDKLGYAIVPAVAGFGVVGIAVGFGAQS